MERRKYETEEEKVALIPELRGVSRQEYLKKREGQKLAEMKDALEDEERLFAVRVAYTDMHAVRSLHAGFASMQPGGLVLLLQP